MGTTVVTGSAAPATTCLRLPKRTGSPGDTLMAWGLALLASDVAKRDVVLRNTPDAFEIEVRAGPDQLERQCADFVPTPRVMLPWLASRERGRMSPAQDIYAVDRDELRDDHERISRLGQKPGVDGDAPVVAAHPLALKYPLFQVLTNPGTQWSGYNSFVERAAGFWSPQGVASILRLFAAGGPDTALDAGLDETMRQLGLAGAGDRRRNPPGFLFPGGNKGPTMRLDRAGVVVGQTAALDWMLADRGDLAAIELYLSYVGFFALGVVLSYKGGRIVAVPVPQRVLVPRVIDIAGQIHPRLFPNSPAAVAADAALAYADAALVYLAGLVAEEAALAARSPVFAGVQLSFFWMPQGNTYAVDHATLAPLPRWLEPLRRQAGFDVAHGTIGRHRGQVQAAGRAEGGEAREAILAYREALSEGVMAWLRLIPLWYRAVLAEKFVGSWSLSEVEQITVTLQPDLVEIIRDPAFEAVTGALRRVTVQAHYARQQRREGGGGGLVSDRPGSRISPQYDLVGALQEAAARNQDEFLRELCEFVADYNNEAMRREQRLIRKEDLEQVIAWIEADRKGLIPALLLAFGVSPARRAAEQTAEASHPEAAEVGASGQ